MPTIIKNLSISGKLTAAFALLIAAFGLVFLVLFSSLNALDRANEQMKVTVRATTLAREMMVSVLDQENAVRAFALSGDSSFVDAYTTRKQELATITAELSKITELPAQRERAQDFTQQTEAWQTGLVSRVFALGGNPDTRAEAQRLASVKSLEKLRGVMAEIQSTEDARILELSKLQDEANAAARMALFVGALCGVGFAAAMGLALSRMIAKPMARMTAAMTALTSGNLSADIPREDRTDEIGRLSQAMLAFRDQLAGGDAAKQAQVAQIVDSIGTGLDALSRGDLTARIDADLTGPFAKLKTDFNGAMDALGATLSAVSQATGGIHTGATEISQASDDLSRRTEQQAASLEETAAAMDEITATVRETASGAVRANEVVAATRGDAEDGGRVVRQAVDAMGGIERASNEISEIISVIDGIAFQTNLLALNAGVEAARAGDAGRGFAVVASEVRALAQRSAEAAKDVKTKITASAGQVEIGVALVGETGQALERIVARIGEISQLVSNITTSAEQQASGLQQVNTAVGEMDSVTQQNAAMVEQSTAAARSLAAEAEDLARHVARFRIGTSAGQSHSAAPTPRAAPAAPARKAVARRPATNGALALKVEHDADDWSQF